MTAGRPIEYKPEMCATVIEHGKDGGSVADICVALGIGRGTFYEWIKTYKEFSDAADVAKTLSLKWWENIGKQMMVEKDGGQRLNSKIWSFSMKGRFPEEYAEGNFGHAGKEPASQMMVAPISADLLQALAKLEGEKKRKSKSKRK